MARAGIYYIPTDGSDDEDFVNWVKLEPSGIFVTVGHAQ
jgi:hypothetical protein